MYYEEGVQLDGCWVQWTIPAVSSTHTTSTSLLLIFYWPKWTLTILQKKAQAHMSSTPTTLRLLLKGEDNI